MGIAIANRKNRCDFGALSACLEGAFDTIAIVAHVTCRSRFPQNPGFLRCSTSIGPPPPKGPVAAVALELPGVSHVELPLKGCRVTGGAATLAGVALHCATKTIIRDARITILIPLEYFDVMDMKSLQKIIPQNFLM